MSARTSHFNNFIFIYVHIYGSTKNDFGILRTTMTLNPDDSLIDDKFI